MKADIFDLIRTVSGISKEDLIEGALHPEKQAAILHKIHKIHENAKPRDVFKEACEELASEHGEDAKRG